MKIGDIVKLIAEPKVGWMKNYLDETFEILSFPGKTGVELKMVGSDPEWKWIIGKDNMELPDENR